MLRLAERAAAPRAGCLKGNIFLSARVCIVNSVGAYLPPLSNVCYRLTTYRGGRITPLGSVLKGEKMSKVAVVFWSGTGNTQTMADAVAAGAQGAGAEVDVKTSSEFGAADVASYDAIAFGCPAMGAEVLEESEFQPMFDDVKGELSGKKIALFGSYGWGDGEWMRNWKQDCRDCGAVLACDSVICNDAPDDKANASLMALGSALVS
jgi:flavodoxin short chain